MPKSKATVPVGKLGSTHPANPEVQREFFPNDCQLTPEERKAIVERFNRNFVTEPIKEV